MGSGAGVGQKPDDWRAVPLCGGDGCHRAQHTVGEPYFWNEFAVVHNHTVDEVIAELVKTSPRHHQIEAEMKEREG